MLSKAIHSLVTSQAWAQSNPQILVIGNGYVGSSLMRYFGRFGLTVKQWTRKSHGYTNPSFDFGAAMRQDFPDTSKGTIIIVNTAGFVGRPNVDVCEIQKKDCFDGNVIFQNRLYGKVAKWSLSCGSAPMFLNISTGCIYNNPILSNERGEYEMFDENNTPNFGLFNHASFYSKMKHISELVLKSTHEAISPPINFESVRIRIPFDESGDPRSYFQKIASFEYIDGFVNSKTPLDLLFLYIISRIVSANRPSLTSTDCSFSVCNVVASEPLSHQEAINTLISTFGDMYLGKVPKEVKSLDSFTPRSNCILSNELMLLTIYDAFNHVEELRSRPLGVCQKIIPADLRERDRLIENYKQFLEKSKELYK